MKIYLLEEYNPNRADVHTTILNVFSTRERAQEWLYHYIKDEYDIEDEFEGDIVREAYPVEYSINSYEVL